MSTLTFRIFLALLLLSIFSTLYGKDIKWGPIYKSASSHDYYFLGSDDGYIYEVEQSYSYYYLRKINKKDLNIETSQRLDLDLDNDMHYKIEGFTLGDNLCFYWLDYLKFEGITTMYLCTLNKSNLQISDPLKIAEYNTPNVDRSMVLADEVATEIFSQNLIRIATSPLGQYCAIISCKGMIGNIAMDNKDKRESPDRIFGITFLDGDFDNRKSIEFIPPDPDFYISYFTIGIDGMIYICGRTSEIDYDFGKRRYGSQVWSYNNLLLYRINPISGEIENNEIDEPGYFVTDYSISVDNNIHITGQMKNFEKNTTSIFYKKFDSNLNQIVDSKQELENEFTANLNLNLETSWEIQEYTKRYKREPPNIPLLNFKLIFQSEYNNESIFTVFEKQTYVMRYSDLYFVQGKLLVFCSDGKKISWKKVIDKAQLGKLDKSSPGSFVYHDGNKLHIYYNTTEPTSIVHLIIDKDGNIDSSNEINFEHKEKTMYLVPSMCYEVSAGLSVLREESTKDFQRLGIINY